MALGYGDDAEPRKVVPARPPVPAFPASKLLVLVIEGVIERVLCLTQVTVWYDKLSYHERDYPFKDASVVTDVNAAAARLVQTAYRARLARQRLDLARRRHRIAGNRRRGACARRIQGAYREWRRWQGEEARRSETALADLRARSATIVQAYYRGAILRLQVARRRALEAELVLQRRAVAAVAMQSLARGFLDRQRVLLRRKEWAAEQLLFHAAAGIQARWRGVMARGRMRAIRAERASYLEEQARRADAGRLLKALLLQAVYRGHLGRELYREALVEAEARRRLLHVKRRRAAVMFQGLYRGYVFRNRRRIRARSHKLARAAARVQQVYRGHLARNDVSQRKFLRLYGHMSEAVTLVANAFRMHGARRQRRAVKELRHQSGMARFLQAVARGHRARLEFRRRVHARYVARCTLLLQLAYRCHVARVLYKDFWQQAHETHAARRLQRVTRGHFARNRVRSFLEKKEKERRERAATNLARVFRGHRGRAMARTERNKLAAKYNMGWLATYTQSLEEVLPRPRVCKAAAAGIALLQALPCFPAAAATVRERAPSVPGGQGRALGHLPTLGAGDRAPRPRPLRHA